MQFYESRYTILSEGPIMATIEGYFDGKAFIPLEPLVVKPNQKVKITLLDDFLTEEKQKQLDQMRSRNKKNK